MLLLPVPSVNSNTCAIDSNQRDFDYQQLDFYFAEIAQGFLLPKIL
jgi:hypothetical protein